MLESLSGGRRREIQEDGIVMEVKNCPKKNPFGDCRCVMDGIPVIQPTVSKH